MMLQSDGAQLARVPQWHQNTNYYNFAVSLQLPALGWSLIYLMDSFRVLFDYYDFELKASIVSYRMKAQAFSLSFESHHYGHVSLMDLVY